MLECRIIESKTPRVETGPVKFGDDWAGIFIRGDNALGYAHYLAAILAQSKASTVCPIYSQAIKGLIALLQDADERKVAMPEEPVKDLIARLSRSDDLDCQKAAMHVRRMSEGLTTVKGAVCGDAQPRWANWAATVRTRSEIADVCDLALGGGDD
jgi:hypothetical protein